MKSDFLLIKDNSEENVYDCPHYEVIYIDDFNVRHIAVVLDKIQIQYLSDRYTIEECILEKIFDKR